MRNSMFFVYVTLANGRRVSGVVSAANYADARRQVGDTMQARIARSVQIERTY